MSKSHAIAPDHVHLEQAFDATQPFQYELVTGIELDTRLPVDALGTQLCT